MTKNNCDYLRISVTDLCNLNCAYCSPRDRVTKLSHDDILRYEEIADFVALIARLGIRKVRITGGEPLIKKNLPCLIGKLKSLPGIDEVAMTTNGVLFRERAERLKEAGLDRVNISLDTLRPDRYLAMTGQDAFDSVWRSVMRALELDLSPVKINVVLFKDVNEDEIFDFVELSRKYPLHVRFIEYMEAAGEGEGYRSVSNGRVLENLRNGYNLVECREGIRGNGPSKYFAVEGAPGYIGFISPNTSCFCDSCNRLRLSCDGKLYPCLFSSHYLNVKDLIRGGKDKEEILARVTGLMGDKHHFTRWGGPGGAGEKDGAEKWRSSNIDMCYIGG